MIFPSVDHFFCASTTRDSAPEMKDFTHSLQGATLFLILSHPDTYAYVSRLTRYPYGSLALATVHAVIFFLITYLITKVTGSSNKKTTTDPAGVVSNTWWFKP